MRTISVIVYTLGVINCFSQDFTGQIVYKTRIVAKRDNINTDSILDATSGDSAIYYISGSRYKCTFFRKGKERYQYIYHHSNFQFYFLSPGIEYITWSDSRKTHDVIRDLKIFRDSTSIILGYPCYTAKKGYDYYTSTAYYSDSIRVNPENIRTLHETFKKYGYNKIFPEYDLTSNPCMIWSYINKPCKDIIDSLVITYPDTETAPTYYREFWNRRKNEQNDTIFNLLRIKYKHPENADEATENFEYLTAIGLNQSAYNMLFEWSWYDDIKWDREKLKDRLRSDSTSCYADPVIEDDTK